MNDDDKNLNSTQDAVEETVDSPVEESPVEETSVEDVQADREELAEQTEAEGEDAEAFEPSEDDVEAEAELQDEVDAENEAAAANLEDSEESESADSEDAPATDDVVAEEPAEEELNPNAKWYVVHTYSGHENRVATNLRQRIESEHLEHKIVDILVPTQDKIEIRGGKKEQVKEKVFPGYILVKMELDNIAWIAVRTTQGVIGFVGAGTKPMPISEAEVKSIVQFMNQGASPTFKEVFLADDTVKIIDGPFADFIGKVESVDKEKGKLRVLVSIFGRETPVELDFLQVSKL